MTPAAVLARLRGLGVVPVVRLPSADLAMRAVEGMIAGGLRTFEITMTIPGALEVIGALARREGLLVGAGTVLDGRQADACAGAGARYVVSPCLAPDVPAACLAAGVACVLGGLTPSEVLRASQLGADAVKVFPASSAGGAAHLRALKEVFPDVPLVPTGGVRLEQLADYFGAGAAFVGVGGDLVDVDALRAGRTDVVAERSRAYVRAVRAIRGAGA